MAQINKALTRDWLHQVAAIDFSADFHALGSMQTTALADKARELGYRKPANANGSTARYFFAYLNRAERNTKD